MRILSFLLIVLLFSPSAFALDTDVWDMDDQKVEILLDQVLANPSGGFKVKTKLIKSLNSFTVYLKDELTPFYKKIHENALQKDHRLMELENLPLVIPIAREHLLNLIPKLKELEGQTLGKEEMAIYAQLMNCLGYILLLQDEVHSFMRNNWEFIKVNNYERTYLVAVDRIAELKEEILRESSRYTTVFRP